ncbi:TetR/AcrR family transcriptional regulator [Aurantiacibacter poecillastricola]|uniref:TetR/AcrR family transcriptional regulator n=1 Tax=Aurantiacibacter poecillastricola TaxID=3064385 RepID=UPI00273D8134|nr:TetR/AcrR family transcriptional regulator [Aurantiacibacter sp. 219JJ12-13]MDP5261248.1 TetR/AcrR family transcriptional regulator [Aurantiacibacter sp. 219JJ12-13]
MSKPRPGIRHRKKLATRDRILDAATKLLAKHGYAALRVAAVAKAAGVSPGGHLHHFQTKDALVVGVLEMISEKALKKAEEDAAKIDSCANPLAVIAGSAIAFYRSTEFLIYLDIHLSARRETKIGAKAVEILVEQRQAIEEMWLPHLLKRDLSQDQALNIIRTLWSLARGLAISSAPQADAEDADVMEFARQLLEQTLLQSARS